MRLTKDNVINAVCIFGIVVTVCIMLTVLLKSFYFQKIDISFIKDIFSIGATLAAALIAISLFNDWKEQHNKTILAPEAIVIYKNLENDIMDISKHNASIKRNIDKLISSSEDSEALNTWGVIITKCNQRLVELKYFSALTKNTDLDRKIEDYFNKLSDFHNYASSIFQSPSNKKISKDIIEKTESFTGQIVVEIEIIKSLLSDYIILK